MSWSERFLGLFPEIAMPLAVILDAEGWREGWLQGEFYRYFTTSENGFRVNCSFCGSRAKHDFYCERPTEMVAELKVYGQRGYYSKNLCGRSNIRRFLPPRRGKRLFLSQREIARLEPTAASYLGDVLRLRRLPAALERYMILVVQKADKPDSFGSAICAVQVSSDELEWDCEDFFVRVSRL
jgi:hypothetical protein